MSAVMEYHDDRRETCGYGLRACVCNCCRCDCGATEQEDCCCDDEIAADSDESLGLDDRKGRTP